MAVALRKPRVDGITLNFTTHDWNQNRLTVIPTGTCSLGQIGPHYLPPGTYTVTVHQLTGINQYTEVGVDYIQISTTGLIHIFKTAIVPRFNGKVQVVYVEE